MTIKYVLNMNTKQCSNCEKCTANEECKECTEYDIRVYYK